LIKVGFSRANEEIQAFRRENKDLRKEVEELKEMTDQGKRKNLCPYLMSRMRQNLSSRVRFTV
jgi:cell division septum initiation protein DivIVA